LDCANAAPAVQAIVVPTSIHFMNRIALSHD
jgi:hypothetical protein